MDPGTALAAVTLVASVAAKLYDISGDYRAAFPELTRVESGLKSLKDVIGGLPDGSHAPLQAVLKDLTDYLGEVEAFADRRLKKLDKKPIMVKLRWYKDHVELEKMEAVLETYKSTLMIALQAQGLRSKEADQKELVAGLKTSLEETLRKATGYELGSQKVQDIRTYLDSVSKGLEERQKYLDETQAAAAAKTTVEVDTGKPMTTWPTYEAWMNSFTPSQQDIQHDEEASAEKEKRGKGKEPETVLASSGREAKSVQDTVRIFITGLSEQPTSDTGKMMTMSPHAEVADILEALHEEGLNWATGFAVGEGDEAPLIGPIINQSAKCTLSTTSSASSYDITTGYAVNMDEMLVSFFNRTLMARRPERNEISISHSFDGIQVEDNYRNKCNTKLTVKLMRTVRVPDDGKTYNLPQDFGPFPILDTKDFAETLPPGMKEQGGIFISMLLREALFLSIVSPESYDRWWWSEDPGEDPEDEIFAVRVLAGRANVVSGSDPLSKAKAPSQDYIIAPKQDRLDGFLAQGKRSTIRQFNAASLGSGYSVEAQVSGTEVGGIQLQFAPRYKRNVAFYVQGADGGFSTLLDLTATPRELNLKPGVLLVMVTLHDPNFYPPRWTWEHKRPHAFDGWGFRLGAWSANRSQHRFRKQAGVSTGVSGGSFPSDPQGVSYEEQRPQTQQPRPEKLNVGHVELARPSRVSDLFAAAGVSHQTPVFIRVVRPVTIRFEVMVAQALRQKCPCLPEQYVLKITASIFEDAASFRQRAKAAVLARTSEMIERSKGMDYNFFPELKARCDGPPKWQVEDTFGNVFPCYMPLHDMEISKTLKGKLYISEWRPKDYGLGMRVSLGVGGTVKQDIHKDKTPRLWNWDAAQVINIQVLNAVAFKSVTGINPPIPAISFEEYTRAGLPLLSFQEPNEGQVSTLITARGAWIKSFRQIDQEHGLAIGIRVREDNGPVICSWCEHRLCDSILLPCRHIFCTWCVRGHMTRRKAATCKFCNTPAPNIKIYAAATAVDDVVLKQQEEEEAPPTKQPVQKLEDLCKNRVRWGGNPDSPGYKPVHALVLSEGTWGQKVGDSDWNLMIAQVLREWEMGLRTEKEVRDLASYALTSGKAAAEGTPEALELLLSLGAKPRNAEERESVLQALEERIDWWGLRERFLAEWE